MKNFYYFVELIGLRARRITGWLISILLPRKRNP